MILLFTYLCMLAVVSAQNEQNTDDKDSDAESAATFGITKRHGSKFKPKTLRTDSSPDSLPSTNERATKSNKDRKRDAKARKVRTPQKLAYYLTLCLPFYAGCGVRAE